MKSAYQKYFTFYGRNSSIVFILFLLIIISRVNAQNCNCDKFIGLNHGYLIDGIAMRINPGDTICLEAGTRANLSIRNIEGTKELPVVIMNCGGKAIIKTTNSYGIETRSSKYFKITGTGSSDTYGIEIIGSHVGLNLGYLSSNFEVDHVLVHDVEFTGIMAKTDPNCQDSLTWGRNYTMYDINIHHNEVFNTRTGEGFYIGYTFFGTGVKCGNSVADAHAIVNAKIHHNYIHKTGAEGIQVGAATEGCEIYNNKIIAYGQNPFDKSDDQKNGLQLGNGTGGLCYNNFIKAGSSKRGTNGIILLGKGDNLLYNNIIINAGECGLFIDERPPSTKTGAGSYFKIINNTIINPLKDGIKTYAELIEYNEIKNNIIVSPGSGKYINTNGCPGTPNVRDSNNYKVNNISLVKFSNPSKDDYHLTALSPAKNAGLNYLPYNIVFDIDGNVRPNGSGYDIGAYEHYPDVPNIPPAITLSNKMNIDWPIDSVKITAKINDSDGQVESILWEKLEGPEANLSQTNTSILLVKNLAKGNYKFRITAKDNVNATSSKEINLIINPN